MTPTFVTGSRTANPNRRHSTPSRTGAAGPGGSGGEQFLDDRVGEADRAGLGEVPDAPSHPLDDDRDADGECDHEGAPRTLRFAGLRFERFHDSPDHDDGWCRGRVSPAPRLLLLALLALLLLVLLLVLLLRHGMPLCSGTPAGLLRGDGPGRHRLVTGRYRPAGALARRPACARRDV